MRTRNWFVACLALAAHTATASSRTGRELLESDKVNVETSFGPVEVHVVEPDSKAKQRGLVLALHGAARGLTAEWLPVASALARHGYRVVMPNAHTNQKTAPGRADRKEVVKALDELANHFAPGQRFTLLGKSWGGAMATEYAIQYGSDRLDSLVLAAPGVKDAAEWKQLGSTNVPVLLLWAEDDSVVPFSVCKEASKQLGSTALVHSELEGGHAVLKPYAEVVTQFLEKRIANT